MKEVHPLSSTLLFSNTMGVNPQKFSQVMILITLLTGFAAMAVAIVAVAKQEYIIAVAMMLVAAWQVINYKKWKKLRK